MGRSLSLCSGAPRRFLIGPFWEAWNQKFQQFVDFFQRGLYRGPLLAVSLLKKGYACLYVRDEEIPMVLKESYQG